MRSFNPTIIVLLLAMSLFAGSPVLADRKSGDGDYKSGYTRGSGHYSGYYRGGGQHGGGYYRGRGYYYGPGFGLSIGSPWYFPPYYYPYGDPFYYPYYPPVVTVPSEPQDYIEKPRSEEQPDSSGVWYYCPESKTYYPYVQECPGGWQTVPAKPSSEPRR